MSAPLKIAFDLAGKGKLLTLSVGKFIRKEALYNKFILISNTEGSLSQYHFLIHQILD
jgi:hypothetical protein